jgi:hypothetical protein
VYDGHSSHASLELIEHAMKNNVILYELPSHTTHRLQPCDVGVFGPLKREWNKLSQRALDETGEQLQAKDVVRTYLTARATAMKAETIRHAFRRSGLVSDTSGKKPCCDINQFTAADFAPSTVTSTSLHLPDGFPLDYGNHIGSGSTVTPKPPSIPPPVPPTPDLEESDESGWESESDVTDCIEEDMPLDESEDAVVSTQSEVGHNECVVLPEVALAFTSTATPIIAHYHDDDTAAHLLSPSSRAAWYKQQLELARSQHDEATSHAVLSGRVISDLQKRLNSKREERKTNRSIHIGGRIVTTQEGRAIALQQKQARVEKENKVAETKQKKSEAELEKQRRRKDLGRDGMVFSGLLAYQRLPMLTDIAWCLNLGEDGTRDDLIGRISAYINEEPAIRNDPRFTSLWTSSRRSLKRPEPVDGPIAGSSGSRRFEPAFVSEQTHIEDISNIPLILSSDGPVDAAKI